MRASRVGVVHSSAHDGVASPVRECLGAIGVDARALVLGEVWRRLDDLEEIVVVGPMFSLDELSKSLPHDVASWPPFAVWFTEQIPSTKAIRSARRLKAFLRSEGSGQRRLALPQKFDSLIPESIREAFDGGHRFRLCNWLAMLHENSRLAILATLTPRRAERFAKELEIPAAYLPYGYHKSFGSPLGLSRDLDVVFLGSLRDRRRARIVTNLQGELTKRGISLHIHDGDRYGPMVFGNARSELLNRTKIMLSVMRRPWDDLVFRVLLGAPNGAMIVSELVEDDQPFEPGVHIETTPVAQLADLIGIFLSSESNRVERAEAARHKVMQELRLELMCERFMSSTALPAE